MALLYVKGSVEEFNENSQAPDAKDIKRLARDLGKRTLKNGKNVWTSLAIYAQEPSLEHPFNIKIRLVNKKGKCFTQLSLKEFDELLAELILWRESNDPGLKRCQLKNDRLLRNHDALNRISAILSNTDYSAPPVIHIDGVNVTELSITREKEIIIKMIESLPKAETKAKKEFLITDICERLDDLQSMEVDVSDIAEHLDDLNESMRKVRQPEENYNYQNTAEYYENIGNRYYNKFVRKDDTQ